MSLVLLHKKRQARPVDCPFSLLLLAPRAIVQPGCPCWCLLQGVVSDSRSGNLPESHTVVARLAYLIDMQTIRIMDLLSNTTLATINHDTRIDWLVSKHGFLHYII